MSSIQEQLATVLKTIKELETVVTKLSEEQKRKDEDLVSAKYCWRAFQRSIQALYKDGSTVYIPVAKGTKGQLEAANKEQAERHAPIQYKLH